MSDDLTPEWTQNAIAVRFSREMLLDMGLAEPTPDEAADREARMREYRARELEAWRIYDDARAVLAEITNPIARAVLDLHAPEDVDYPKCGGCDVDGYEAEAPEWPCRTVRAVAGLYGIPLPTVSLWSRPKGDA